MSHALRNSGARLPPSAQKPLVEQADVTCKCEPSLPAGARPCGHICLSLCAMLGPVC